MEDKYLRVDEVADFLSIGISTVWIKSKNDEDFPKPKKLSERITVWQKSELIDFVNGKNNADNKN